ncbi:hypothetical protein G4L39_02530 [Limisphaera ngatamarikiensis]|uniref:YncE family protein n=1 Tax=Limisphaera ngatamarikiensis TaxID=1324935 RepID=A0A6M1RKU3_9BACT|nr:hypothetical protein [Limisphaera ngatamarikiensis]NGO38273.1 hypothetical protein [Limisphaera ngatamarikiensis]
MKSFRGSGAGWLGLLGMALVAQAVEAAVDLQEVRAWPLPGRVAEVGRLAPDPAQQRLFVALPQADTVQVLDLAAGRFLRPLSVPSPRALWYEQRPKILYVGSDSSGGQIKILDVEAWRTLKTVGRLPGVVQIRRDPPSFRIYAAHGEGALAVLHADTGVHTLSILLPDRPGDVVLERSGQRIFVSLQRSNAIAVVDRLTREMTEVWALNNARQPGPLALDEDRSRLYIACASPGSVLVWDTAGAREVERLPVEGAVRWLFVDPVRKRLLAGTDAGQCHVWQVEETGKFTHLGAAPLGSGRTEALYDPEEGALFVALPQERGQPAAIRKYVWRR